MCGMKKFVVLLAFAGIVIGCDDENDPVVIPTSTKLDYYEETFDIPGLGFEPQLKTIYDYNSDGSLKGYTFYGYDPEADSLLEQRHFEFSYSDGTTGSRPPVMKKPSVH